MQCAYTITSLSDLLMCSGECYVPDWHDLCLLRNLRDLEVVITYNVSRTVLGWRQGQV
jgi:hypothetical protein